MVDPLSCFTIKGESIMFEILEYVSLLGPIIESLRTIPALIAVTSQS